MNEGHDYQCPLYEDNIIEHKCEQSKVIIWDLRWKLQVKHVHGWTSVEIQFCPFCGEELEQPKCVCDEIRVGRWERELDLKHDGAL